MGSLLKPDGTTETVQSKGVQYNLGEAAAISVPLSFDGTYSLTDIRINSGGFGSAPGVHLALSRQSSGGAYSGGDSPESSGEYSQLPNIQFSVETADHEATAKAVADLINSIGTVSYTAECKTKIDTARRAYNSASSAVKALITEEQLKVLTDAEAAYVKFEEAAIEAGIQTKTIDEKPFYVLTGASELKWFAKMVNDVFA